jgi:hypothetical protein
VDWRESKWVLSVPLALVLLRTIETHSKRRSARYQDTPRNFTEALVVINRRFGTFREGGSEIVG